MFPAARTGADFALAPAFRIIEGSENVFVNNFPWARAGDDSLTPIGPKPILEGSQTVFVNNMPAARAGADFATIPILRLLEGSENVFVG